MGSEVTGVVPNIKSAVKRVELAEKRRVRNAAEKSKVRTVIKRFEKTLAEGDAEAGQNHFKLVAHTIDRAVSKGVLHKNAAARKKSRLARELNKAANLGQHS